MKMRSACPLLAATTLAPSRAGAPDSAPRPPSRSATGDPAAFRTRYIRPLALGLACLGAAVAPGSAGAQSARPFKLCVVDENMLVARSPVAPKIAERFQQVRNQLQQSYQADSARLETDIRNLAKETVRANPLEERARKVEIAQRRDALRARGEEMNRNLAALDAELTKNVVQLATPSIRAIAATRGCSAVVPRSALLDLGDMSLDITAAVLGGR